MNSPNDLVYDSKGNLYFTDPPYGLLEGDNDKLKEIEFNGVYKVSPNGDIEVLVKNLTRPNGISISNDEKILILGKSKSLYQLNIMPTAFLYQIRQCVFQYYSQSFLWHMINFESWFSQTIFDIYYR